jgi:hypothetical protein
MLTEPLSSANGKLLSGLESVIRRGEIFQTGVLPFRVGGSSSAVERQLPKLDVAGSIPVSRSIFQELSYFMTAWTPPPNVFPR